MRGSIGTGCCCGGGGGVSQSISGGTSFSGGIETISSGGFIHQCAHCLDEKVPSRILVRLESIIAGDLCLVGCDNLNVTYILPLIVQLEIPQCCFYCKEFSITCAVCNLTNGYNRISLELCEDPADNTKTDIIILLAMSAGCHTGTTNPIISWRRTLNHPSTGLDCMNLNEMIPFVLQTGCSDAAEPTVCNGIGSQAFISTL